jgi:hypothetical protein
MVFNTANRRVSFDLPHAAFVTAIVAFCAWYLHDARINSTDFVDLLLVQPIAIGVFIVYFVIMWGTVKVEPRATPSVRVAERPALTRLAATRIFGSMGLVTLYVVSLTWIGFDIATFVYVAATLFLLGERRWWMLVLVPGIFCAMAIYLFNAVLLMPLPLTLGPAQ